jgi:hypothetical protein
MSPDAPLVATARFANGPPDLRLDGVLIEGGGQCLPPISLDGLFSAGTVPVWVGEVGLVVPELPGPAFVRPPRTFPLPVKTTWPFLKVTP